MCPGKPQNHETRLSEPKNRHAECQWMRPYFHNAAKKLAHRIHFVVVDCGAMYDFCKSRHPKSFPHIELFMKQDVRNGMLLLDVNWLSVG